MRVLVGITTSIEETIHFWIKQNPVDIKNFNQIGPFGREKAEEIKHKKIKELNASPLSTTMYSSYSKYKWWVYIVKVSEES